MNRAVLSWLARILLAVGIGGGLWCVATLIEAHFFKHLPVPHSNRANATGSASSRPANGGWVAKLDAPSVDLSATVLEGSDDATLARAAGHIEDTPLPGEPGNVGIAGHRDTTFRAVRDIKAGDVLTLTTQQGRFDYRVARTMIVEPEDVYVLDNAGHQSLTLVTCYPFEFIGHAPRRYVIQADRF